MKGTLQTALAAAPLDLAEAWAVAVRFALNALAHTSPQAMQAVLHIIIQRPPQGEEPATQAGCIGVWMHHILVLMFREAGFFTQQGKCSQSCDSPGAAK